MRSYYVYILTNASRTLYIGVTNNLERRLWEHKQRRVRGFTRKYNVTLLGHMEEFAILTDAIAREKQLKGWSRNKKIALIEEANPEWRTLAQESFLDR